MSKVILITGGNSGIGLETVKQLAERGATVCLACRNQAKAEDARKAVLAENPNANIEIYPLDLSSFKSISQCVALFLSKHDRLDALINNAGAAPLTQRFTNEGFELQFGANYLGHFLLTHRLIEPLKKAVEKNGEARIVNVASIAHMVANLDESTFKGCKRYKPASAYAQSKLCNLMFSYALARRLPAGITSQAYHPGGVDSEIWRELPKLAYLALKPFLISTKRGGVMGADLAESSEYKGKNGGYYSVQWPRPVSRTAKDQQKQDWLYIKSCELTQITGLDV